MGCITHYNHFSCRSSNESNKSSNILCNDQSSLYSGGQVRASQGKTGHLRSGDAPPIACLGCFLFSFPSLSSSLLFLSSPPSSPSPSISSPSPFVFVIFLPFPFRVPSRLLRSELSGFSSSTGLSAGINRLFVPLSSSASRSLQLLLDRSRTRPGTRVTVSSSSYNFPRDHHQLEPSI